MIISKAWEIAYNSEVKIDEEGCIFLDIDRESVGSFRNIPYPYPLIDLEPSVKIILKSKYEFKIELRAFIGFFSTFKLLRIT